VNYSRRGSPCPVCDREKDNDCRWTNETIFCHQGSSHSAPDHLKLGDTIEIRGDKWALVSLSSGYDNSAYLFKPHKDNIFIPKTKEERDQSNFDISVRVGSCEYYAKEFIDLAQKALDVLDFETALPDELKKSFNFIYSADSKGQELIRELQQLAPKEARLKPYLPIVKDLIKQLHYQRKDADQFRKNYLGEVLPNE
tara:strand:- start:958 stop:1548 length:591 start_codon:yes stop_codon:yes gene_type:complete